VAFDLSPPSLSAIPSARPHSATSIEWAVSSSSLGLLVNNVLFPFAKDVSVKTVLSSGLPIKIAPARKHEKVHCAILGADRKAVSSHAILGELLAKNARPAGMNDLSLKCVASKGKATSRSVTYGFHSFVAPIHRPNEIRARNALRRELTGEDAPYPMDSKELIGDDWAGIWGWAESFILHHWGALHPFLDYTQSTTQTGRWHLNTGAVLQKGIPTDGDDVVRIAVAADWGAGTLESDYVQKVMMVGNGTAFNPHWTIHVGDIYFVGSSDWVQSNCLGQAKSGVTQGVTWPHGSLGSFAVEGNHEMYARATGFFDTFLPTLGVNDASGKPQGQQAGFVSMENKYWRVILLDTGYNTYSLIPKMDNRNNTQPQAVIDWLVNVVDIGNPEDTRGIIFMTHHQVESAFEQPYLATPTQIAALMPPGRTVVWLWGHEHRLAFYEKFSLPNSTVPLNIYGRCIGNSGFPSSIGGIPPRAKESGLMAYDDRVYDIESGFFTTQVGYNGFIRLTLQQNTAEIVYSSIATDPATGELSPTLETALASELFEVDEAGNVSLSNFSVLGNLTVISQ
jgi:hypothetical protein